MFSYHHCIIISWMMAFSLSLAVGCEGLVTDLEPNPESIELSQIIVLTRTGEDSLSISDASVDTLIAYIPNKATVKQITFTTSLGDFELNGKQTITVNAIENKNVNCELYLSPCSDALRATAVIKPGMDTGTGFIVATINGYTSEPVQIEITQ